jgi:predicted MFS family arabinose efflux permease
MLAMYLLGNAQSLPMVLLVSVLQAFGASMGHPALQAESIRLLGQEHSGVATSTYYIGADLGIGGGPMLGGIIASHWGYTVMYHLAAVSMLVGLLGFLWYLKLRKSARA